MKRFVSLFIILISGMTLSAACAALRQLAVQREATKVDGYRPTTFDTQRAVAEVDICRDSDVRTVVGDCCTQFIVCSYVVVRCPRTHRAQQGCKYSQ